MKKIAGILLCLFVLSLSLFAQSGKASRPRVVVTDSSTKTGSTPSTTNQTQGNPGTVQSGPRKPPVLIGDNTSKSPVPQQAPVTPAGSQDEGIIDDEVIKVETSLVTIPVSVLDRNGRYVSGLQKNDFHIFEDGAEQKIEYFASIEQPFTVVLLLDVSASTQFKIDEIQNAAITFVNQLKQDDRVMVITFDEKVRVLTQPTNDRAQLRDAIRQARFGGGTSLYEAVQVAMERELKNVQGKKAIVLFTDGVDTTSRKASYHSTIRNAEEIDSMIYTIRYDTYGDMNGGMGGGNYPSPAPRRRSGGSVLGQILGSILTGGSISIGNGGGSGGGSSRSEYEKGRQYLEQLAQVSGGRKFEAQNTYNLDAAFSGIAEELRRQYSIGYYPEKEGQPGQRKQIKVRVDESNAVVRAKNSYIVGENENGNIAAQKPVQKTAPTIKTPSRFPF